MSFDIAADENPVELRHYEAVGQELQIAYVWQIDFIPTPTPIQTPTIAPIPTPTPTPVPTPSPTPVPLGTVIIENIDLQEEIVVIANLGDSPIELTGWRLVSEVGNQDFVFPEFTLGPSQRVEITSGPNAQDDPPGKLHWTGRYIWNNEGDSGALYDASERLMSRFTP
ncbi:MAG: lamin tail domain-containing protein [Dehalococcoidia bacterium]